MVENLTLARAAALAAGLALAAQPAAAAGYAGIPNGAVKPLPGLVLAQATGGQDGVSDAPGGGSGLRGRHFDASGKAVAGAAAPLPVAVQVAGLLQRSAGVCNAIDEAYQVDCVRHYFRLAAAQLPQVGEYGRMRAALTKAADDLDRLVAANADPARAPIRVGSGADRTGRLRPVAPAAVPRVRAEAARIVAEAETVLLRSGGSRSDAYVQVASAVGSNKVLLRS